MLMHSHVSLHIHVDTQTHTQTPQTEAQPCEPALQSILTGNQKQTILLSFLLTEILEREMLKSEGLRRKKENSEAKDSRKLTRMDLAWKVTRFIRAFPWVIWRVKTVGKEWTLSGGTIFKLPKEKKKNVSHSSSILKKSIHGMLPFFESPMFPSGTSAKSSVYRSGVALHLGISLVPDLVWLDICLYLLGNTIM